MYTRTIAEPSSTSKQTQYNFGTESTRATLDHNTLRKLDLIRQAAVKVADDPKLNGACSCVAVAVKVACGGEVVKGKVEGADHFWNRLPCGTEIDLTGTQFGGDGWTPLVQGKPARLPKLIPLEVLSFIQSLQLELGKPV